jgi:hypothetical protein
MPSAKFLSSQQKLHPKNGELRRFFLPDNPFAGGGQRRYQLPNGCNNGTCFQHYANVYCAFIKSGGKRHFVRQNKHANLSLRASSCCVYISCRLVAWSTSGGAQRRLVAWYSCGVAMASVRTRRFHSRRPSSSLHYSVHWFLHQLE